MKELRGGGEETGTLLLRFDLVIHLALNVYTICVKKDFLVALCWVSYKSLVE